MKTNKRRCQVASVTRLLIYFLIFGHLRTTLNIAQEHGGKICQSKLKMLPNTKCTLSKWPKVAK